ncbi:hypothetical protein K4Q22_00900 [Staphylococcus epidermidis]|uniref:hypothetical protein n=1 Tax=Staphylococcus epidermidis TaxID=1282 RepID=UPI0028870CFC|nr:hypothetical protein [Staphylococcus epidermidis]MCG2360583.1 hypothetical protein [Staphylococcus epidermidis]MDT0741423.1 hypothetical protein [Staphylococcus epidermidis]
MEYIDDALKVIDDLKTHQFISNEIIRENEKSLCKELEKYKELNKIIEQLSSKLNG